MEPLPSWECSLSLLTHMMTVLSTWCPTSADLVSAYVSSTSGPSESPCLQRTSRRSSSCQSGHWERLIAHSTSLTWRRQVWTSTRDLSSACTVLWLLPVLSLLLKPVTVGASGNYWKSSSQSWWREHGWCRSHCLTGVFERSHLSWGCFRRVDIWEGGLGFGFGSWQAQVDRRQ